jgi:hypothetical protein
MKKILNFLYYLGIRFSIITVTKPKLINIIINKELVYVFKFFLLSEALVGLTFSPCCRQHFLLLKHLFLVIIVYNVHMDILAMLLIKNTYWSGHSLFHFLPNRLVRRLTFSFSDKRGVSKIENRFHWVVIFFQFRILEILS